MHQPDDWRSQRAGGLARRVLLALLCVLPTACGGGGGGGAGADALTISPASLSVGTSGDFYGVTLFATGGSGAGYAWDLAGGALPPNLVGLPATGPIVPLTGVLGTPGTYDFTVRLRDATGAEVTRPYSLTINPTGGGGGGGGGGGNFATTLVGAPSARSGHTAVWTGTEMIVWGGGQLAGVLGDGAAYDPTTDAWRPIATTGAPEARFAHSAVWTGTEMIVWGGSSAQGPLATGGAYDPVQDTWRPLSTAGAPQARVVHTAVWTGTAMVVWGGQGMWPPPAPNSTDLVFADGGSYDPVADQWSPIAPRATAARRHTAVWTGSRMITWGGHDSFALTLSTLNVGGLYDPAQNAWTATSLTGVPSARTDHTAVWTGTAMIVWGGQESLSAVTDTGGRYLPGPDSWSATALVGAPSPRTAHSAVWTGTEMVVWGGTGPGAILNDGAVYQPGTNTWRPLAAGLVPSARYDHTAVWTGIAMIVWGGASLPGGTVLGTGAVMQP